MREQIYTIPINEAFEEAIEAKERGECICPLCTVSKKLEEDELDLILGASMMEPDIRIKTNEQGFCADHFSKMLRRQKRLPLALMLESHLNELNALLNKKGIFGTSADKGAKRIASLRSSSKRTGKSNIAINHPILNGLFFWFFINQVWESKHSQLFYTCKHLQYFRRRYLMRLKVLQTIVLFSLYNLSKTCRKILPSFLL